MLLNKIFIECRYKNNLLFYDMEKLLGIYRNNSEIFDSQNFNRNDNIFQLISQKDKINATITAERMIFDMDSPMSIENFKNKAIKYCESVNNILGIDEYIRIGIRAFWGIEVDSMQVAVSTIKAKFFKPELDKLGFMSGNVTMTGIGFSNEDGEFKLNIGVNPNQINIVEVTNGQTTKNIMRKEINLDIDIYKDEDVKTKNVYSIMKNMIEMNKAKAENLTNYIRGD